MAASCVPTLETRPHRFGHSLFAHTYCILSCIGPCSNVVCLLTAKYGATLVQGVGHHSPQAGMLWATLLFHVQARLRLCNFFSMTLQALRHLSVPYVVTHCELQHVDVELDGCQQCTYMLSSIPNCSSSSACQKAFMRSPAGAC